MVSPIVNACPSEHKDKAMSLLHSFYCWGQVGTVAAANGDSLQAGLLVGALFPVILLVGVIALRQILYTTHRAG